MRCLLREQRQKATGKKAKPMLFAAGLATLRVKSIFCLRFRERTRLAKVKSPACSALFPGARF